MRIFHSQCLYEGALFKEQLALILRKKLFLNMQCKFMDAHTHIQSGSLKDLLQCYVTSLQIFIFVIECILGELSLFGTYFKKPKQNQTEIGFLQNSIFGLGVRYGIESSVTL